MVVYKRQGLSWLAHAACAAGLMVTIPSLHAEPVKITSPGWTWGRVYYPEDFERQGKDHVVYNVIAERALKFTKASWPVAVELFIRSDVKQDTIGTDYDNRSRAAVGARVSGLVFQGFTVYGGGRYDVEVRSKTGESASGLVGFVGWRGWWKLKDWKERPFLSSLTLSTWGEAQTAYAMIGDERQNGILEGTVQLDAELYKLHPKVAFVGRGQAAISFDTDGRDYRNWVEPSMAGLMRYQPKETFYVELGARAASRWQVKTGDSQGGLSGFLQFGHQWGKR